MGLTPGGIADLSMYTLAILLPPDSCGGCVIKHVTPDLPVMLHMKR